MIIFDSLHGHTCGYGMWCMPLSNSGTDSIFDDCLARTPGRSPFSGGLYDQFILCMYSDPEFWTRACALCTCNHVCMC